VLDAYVFANRPLVGTVTRSPTEIPLLSSACRCK
jgi:hypothetical protein